MTRIIAILRDELEKMASTSMDAIIGLNDFTAKIEKQKRKQKSIDRLAWRAEDIQRKAKGGHWK
jgi:hypothetical protein